MYILLEIIVLTCRIVILNESEVLFYINRLNKPAMLHLS